MIFKKTLQESRKLVLYARRTNHLYAPTFTPLCWSYCTLYTGSLQRANQIPETTTEGLEWPCSQWPSHYYVYSSVISPCKVCTIACKTICTLWTGRLQRDIQNTQMTSESQWSVLLSMVKLTNSFISLQSLSTNREDFSSFDSVTLHQKSTSCLERQSLYKGASSMSRNEGRCGIESSSENMTRWTQHIVKVHTTGRLQNLSKLLIDLVKTSS